ncbi:MAG: Ig-like domain-containing protein [Gemmatimonadetes bacterium]|nr:Ig-like domain-containing protein [Gemmatimonadota bacterium]
MRKTLAGVVALVAVGASQTASAQRALNLEVGAFGQFTIQDSDLNIANGPTIGGRLALYLLKNLAAEVDGQLGKADWEDGSTTTSLTLRPWAARLVYGIPLNEKTRFLIGAGYQQNQYSGRTKTVAPGFVQPNEYEDAVTGLVGIKYCMNDKWNFRVDGVGDYNPSPNFNGQPPVGGNSEGGTALNLGLRAGFGTMIRGNCPGSPFSWALAVAPASSRHRVGEVEQLQVTARDAKGASIPLSKLKNYTCTSDNPNVATVDANGRVSAVSPGTATITCSGMMGGVLQSGTHQITVRRPDWRLTVNGGGTHQVGQGGSASASAVDEDNRPVTGALAWSSSNTSVATVDNNGNYRCVGAGNATITATMTRADETRSGSVQVICNAPPPPPPPPPAARLVANLTDVHFGFDQATLTRAGRDTLNWVIGQLNSAAGSSWVISIEGHTDPYGSEAYNDRLSKRRAQTVYNYLTRARGGVPASRISSQQGFGEACLLLDDDHTSPQKAKSEHARNRRVEIWNLNGTAAPTGCRPMSDYQNR